MTQKTPKFESLHDSDQRCEPVSLRPRKTSFVLGFWSRIFQAELKKPLKIKILSELL